MPAKLNAYSIFVNDVFHRRTKAGEQVNKAGLFQELGPEWQQMPDDMKQRYKDRAKSGQWKPQGGKNSSGDQSFDQNRASSSRSSASGAAFDASQSDIKVNIDRKPDTKWFKRSFSDNEDERQGCRQDGGSSEPAFKKSRPGIPKWREPKKGFVVDTVRYFDYESYTTRKTCENIVSSRARVLLSIPIYSFSCNVLCKYKSDGRDGYIPIEIGIYAYSINKGRLKSPYHALINAGEPPNNFMNLSSDHVATHKINFRPSYPQQSRVDYARIYEEMCEYTRGGERTILIADHRDKNQVIGCLEWLHTKATQAGGSYPRVSTWTVIPIVEYVATAFNFVYQHMLKKPHPRFALHYYINELLGGCTMDYYEDLMCDYHRREENATKWCARSCAIRSLSYIERNGLFEEIKSMYELANSPHFQAEMAAKQQQEASKTLAIQPNPSQTTEECIVQIDEPPLAIEAPPSTCQPPPQPMGPAKLPVPISVPNTRPMVKPINDPRLAGRVKFEPNPISTIRVANSNPNETIFFDPCPSPPPLPPRPKPKKEPLVITSAGPALEYPPDVF